MTGHFLDRLASRALGRARFAEPALSPRVVPEVPVDATPAPAGAEDAQVVTTSLRTEPPVRSSAESHVVDPRPNSHAIASAQPIIPESRLAVIATAKEPAALDVGQSPASKAHAPTTRVQEPPRLEDSVERSHAAPRDAPILSRATGTNAPEHSAPTLTKNFRTRTADADRPRPRSEPVADASDPVVQVTIGRVDVRAIQQSPAPRPIREIRTTGRTLSEYLAQRNRDRRGG